MLYDRPVWQLMRDCAAAMKSPFRSSDVVDWFRRHYPDVNEGTVYLHLTGLTANTRGGAPNTAGKPPLFWWLDHGTYELYDPEKHEGVSSVTTTGETSGQLPSTARSQDHRGPPVQGTATIVLVGCVKSKGQQATRARDLYVSNLFRKRRAYAEGLGARWYILSAKHGLLHPDDAIGPYDVYLAEQPATYRRAWGAWAVAQLQALHDLRGQRVEVHASEAYVAPIRDLLSEAGATVETPLAHLTRGEQLAWYVHSPTDTTRLSVPPTGSPSVRELAAQLSDPDTGLSPSQLLERGPDGLESAGLYSWWVEADGAEDLTAGLRHSIEPGLVYVGQAGATRSRSNKASSNTLWKRLTAMHLGSRAEMSTLRRTLAAALSAVLGLTDEDDPQLSAWIARNMTVVPVAVHDHEALSEMEAAVLERLDPPLNLRGRPDTPVRQELSRRRSGSYS